MYLKWRARHKDGKTHVYFSLCESLRVSRGRAVQRQVLQLGELNTTRVDAWQRIIEVLHEGGQRYQQRLFTDRDGPAPCAAGDVPWAIVVELLAVNRLLAPRSELSIHQN